MTIIGTMCNTPEKSIVGAVESWGSGFGILRGEDNKTYKAHFTDFENYKRNNKQINLEIGQEVTFTPERDEKGRWKAINIFYDSRHQLFKFAFFLNYEEAIAELATEHAEKEKWSASGFNEENLRKELEEKASKNKWSEDEKRKHKDKAEKDGKQFIELSETDASNRVTRKIDRIILRQKYDVLISYFEHTFERVKLEEKIVHAANNAAAAFNTGLANKFGQDIYAVFKINDREGSQFVFKEFAGRNAVGKNFPKLPEMPNYFTDNSTGEKVPSDQLLFDCEKEIFPDDTHLHEERIDRFPASWKDKSLEDRVNEFGKLLDSTKNRVKRNFRAAIPFYYPTLRKVQMLLPITFDPGTDKASTSALVVSREGAGYSIETIMPLDWAYKNARLLAKPDREDWLDF